MKLKIIMAAMLVISLGACKKSFIELVPQTRVTEANFFQTADDFNQAATGAYAPLHGLYANAWVMGELRSDNSTYFNSPGLSGGQFVSRYAISNFTDVPNNPFNSEKYDNCYSGIAKTNAILDRIDDADIDEAVKANVKGQAQFLRAFYYFELVQYYGGVPLHLSEVKSYAETTLPRTSADSVYQQVIADATSAANLLPATQTTTGMVTKGSAETLLGYIYMTLKRYADAETALTSITALGYSLLPDYADIFKIKNNAESIFEVQYIEGGQGQQNNFAFQFAPNVTNVYYILGVAGNNLTTGGWNKPTPDLIAAYEPGDTRKAATIADHYVIPDPNDASKLDTIYDNYVIKYTHPPYAQFNNAGDDWMVYRYADVLLLLSECLNEENKAAQAIPYLNQVRARAGLAATTAVSQDDVRTAIAHERRVELAFENHRWLDLVRTGQAIPVMTAYGVKIKQELPYIPADAYTDVTEKRLIFPLPLEEVQTNKLLKQNPGYE